MVDTRATAASSAEMRKARERQNKQKNQNVRDGASADSLAYAKNAQSGDDKRDGSGCHGAWMLCIVLAAAVGPLLFSNKDGAPPPTARLSPERFAGVRATCNHAREHVRKIDAGGAGASDELAPFMDVVSVANRAIERSYSTALNATLVATLDVELGQHGYDIKRMAQHESARLARAHCPHAITNGAVDSERFVLCVQAQPPAVLNSMVATTPGLSEAMANYLMTQQSAVERREQQGPRDLMTKLRDASALVEPHANALTAAHVNIMRESARQCAAMEDAAAEAAAATAAAASATGTRNAESFSFCLLAIIVGLCVWLLGLSKKDAHYLYHTVWKFVLPHHLLNKCMRTLGVPLTAFVFLGIVVCAFCALFFGTALNAAAAYYAPDATKNFWVAVECMAYAPTRVVFETITTSTPMRFLSGSPLRVWFTTFVALPLAMAAALYWRMGSENRDKSFDEDDEAMKEVIRALRKHLTRSDPKSDLNAQ